MTADITHDLDLVNG